jgi:hypothetical protein
MPTANMLRLTVLLCALALASCGGAPVPASPAETAVPPDPTAAPPPTAVPTNPPAPTVAPTQPPISTSLPTIAPAPTTVPTEVPAGPIPGTLARGTVLQRPYVVMIDNHPNAYPQSGLDKAAVVFEALAEFGLTRFMAVYAPGITEDADAIGPVRSTRLYFVQWALPFAAMYVHAGGSPQGLELAQTSPAIINVDALFRASSGYFIRSSSRAAPHNLYTTSADLEEAAAASTVNPPIPTDLGFIIKQEAEASQRPNAQTIGYFFLYREDDVRWLYDSSTNSYGRFRRGNAAVDGESGQQLRAKNLVVMEVQEEAITGDEKGRIEQQVIGSGKARVFLDGVEREVTWSKGSAEEQLTFIDGSGEEVQFNPGQIWIVALPSLDNLTVS